MDTALLTLSSMPSASQRFKSTAHKANAPKQQINLLDICLFYWLMGGKVL